METHKMQIQTPSKGTATMEEKNVQKTPKILTVLLIVLSVLTAASLLLSAATMIKTDTTLDAVQKSLGDKTEETREDDVVIMEEYEIKSTLQISDAYRSGDTSALSDKDKETLDLAKAVLDEIITEDMTPFDKEKAVYDWMTANLQYDEGAILVIPTTQEDSDNPYGTLKFHNAVCVGYATTFRLFMQMMDIPCMVVHNLEAYHSWDLVRLGDNWYHTDIYSDVGTGNYTNFNMNDSIASAGHDWDREFFPSADSLEYNVVYMNSTEVENIYDIPAEIRTLLEEGGGVKGFLFPSDFTEDEAQAADNMMLNIESLICDTEEFGYVMCEHSWSPVDNGYLLSFTLTPENSDDPEDPDPVIDDETQEKIDLAVEESFGDLTSNGMYYDEDYEDDEFAIEPTDEDAYAPENMTDGE